MAVGNALMDMYNEMQAELAQKEKTWEDVPTRRLQKPKQ